jgi:hypothetical protein
VEEGYKDGNDSLLGSVLIDRMAHSTKGISIGEATHGAMTILASLRYFSTL